MLVAVALTLTGLFQAQAAPTEEPRRLRVVVAQRLNPGEAPVSGLRVEVGMLPKGEEVGPPGTRAVAKTVELGADGRLELELDPRGAPAVNPALWARVVSPGYQQDHGIAAFHPAQAEVRVWVQARRGGTLYGTVGPPGGTDRASLRLVSTSRPASAALATADELGRFCVHFGASGRYHLQVSRAGQGTAFVRDLALDAREAARTIAVEIAPGLALAGSLSDPDGKPVYSTIVSALPEDLLPVEAEIPERAWSSGHYGERVVTDPDGRFRLKGLPPGRYVLIGALDGPPQPLAEERFAAGEEDVSVVARVHRLRVRVFDARGMGVGLSTHSVHAFSRKPAGPILALDALGDTRPRSPVPFPSEVVRAVEPGDELRLAYVDARTTLVERIVTIPERPWLVEEGLHLPPPVEPARLRVSWSTDPIGNRIALGLLSTTGVDLGRTSLQWPPTELELAPGRYWVRAQDTYTIFCSEGDPEERVAPFTFADVAIELAAGESRSLELTAVARARLSILLAGPPRGSPEEIAYALQFPDTTEHLRRAVGGARIELHPAAGGPPFHPVFAVALSEWEDLTVPRPLVAPGRECTLLSPLAPGPYRLRAFLADGRVIERDVELAAGAKTVVELEP